MTIAQGKRCGPSLVVTEDLRVKLNANVHRVPGYGQVAAVDGVDPTAWIGGPGQEEEGIDVDTVSRACADEGTIEGQGDCPGKPCFAGQCYVPPSPAIGSCRGRGLCLAGPRPFGPCLLPRLPRQSLYRIPFAPQLSPGTSIHASTSDPRHGIMSLAGGRCCSP